MSVCHVRFASCIPPLDPVAEIVGNDKPWNKSSSLSAKPVSFREMSQTTSDLTSGISLVDPRLDSHSIQRRN